MTLWLRVNMKMWIRVEDTYQLMNAIYLIIHMCYSCVSTRPRLTSRNLQELTGSWHSTCNCNVSLLSEWRETSPTDNSVEPNAKITQVRQALGKVTWETIQTLKLLFSLLLRQLSAFQWCISNVPTPTRGGVFQQFVSQSLQFLCTFNVLDAMGIMINLLCLKKLNNERQGYIDW